MNNWVSFLLFGSFIVSPLLTLKGQTDEEKYLQDIKTEITIPREAGKNVINLFLANQSVIAVTTDGVFRYRNGQWSGKPNGTDWRTATIDNQGNVWLATTKFIQK